MNKREFAANRLDVRSFCAAGARLEGAVSVTGLDRLASQLAASDAVPGADVRWSLSGSLQPVTGGDARSWLALRADAAVPLVCQRCLAPVQMTLEVDRRFLFVSDEANAERLDAELEEDVLAFEREFDALALIEDELLLSLPLVPRHDVCPDPMAAAEPPAEPAPNPFAALAGWAGASRRDD